MANKGPRPRGLPTSGSAWLEKVDWGDSYTDLSQETKVGIEDAIKKYHLYSKSADRQMTRTEFRKAATELMNRLRQIEESGDIEEVKLIDRLEWHIVRQVKYLTPESGISLVSVERIKLAIKRCGAEVHAVREVDAFSQAVIEIHSLLKHAGADVRLSTRFGDSDLDRTTPIEQFLGNTLRGHGTGPAEIKAIHRAFDSKQ